MMIDNQENATPVMGVECFNELEKERKKSKFG